MYNFADSSIETSGFPLFLAMFLLGRYVTWASSNKLGLTWLGGDSDMAMGWCDLWTVSIDQKCGGEITSSKSSILTTKKISYLKNINRKTELDC